MLGQNESVCAKEAPLQISDNLQEEVRVLNEIEEILNSFEIVVTGNSKEPVKREEPACLLHNIDIILDKSKAIRSRLSDLKNEF